MLKFYLENACPIFRPNLCNSLFYLISNEIDPKIMPRFVFFFCKKTGFYYKVRIMV